MNELDKEAEEADQEDVPMPGFLRRAERVVDPPVLEIEKGRFRQVRSSSVLALPEPAHAPLAPSAGYRWIPCPGSIRLCAGKPDDNSFEAREGTAAHSLAEECLRDKADAWERVKQVITVDGEDFTVDKEMADGVQLYLDVIADDIRQSPVAPAVYTEERVSLASVIDERLWGTLDRGHVWPTHMRVMDLKYGKGLVVEAEENIQLKIYAYGLWLKVGPKLQATIEEIELIIVQPRDDQTGRHIKRWKITIADLRSWVNTVLVPAAAATLDPDAPLVTGDHCHYCPVAKDNSCPALAREFEDMSQRQDVKNLAFAHDPSLEGWELGALLTQAKVVERYIQMLRGEAFARLQKGRDVTGWKMVEGRGSRSWHEAAEATFEGQFGDEAYDPAKFKSPSKMEKIGPKAKKLVAEHSYRVPGNLTMAAEGDKREAVKAPSPEEAFADIPKAT